MADTKCPVTYEELKEATESFRNADGAFDSCGMSEIPEIRDYVLSLDSDSPFVGFIATGYELGVQVGLKIAETRAGRATNTVPTPEPQPPSTKTGGQSATA